MKWVRDECPNGRKENISLSVNFIEPFNDCILSQPIYNHGESSYLCCKPFKEPLDARI